MRKLVSVWNNRDRHIQGQKAIDLLLLITFIPQEVPTNCINAQFIAIRLHWENIQEKEENLIQVQYLRIHLFKVKNPI